MKNQNSLQRYLTLEKLSVAQAAQEIGCSRQYVYMLLKGYQAGKQMATRVEQWSNGYVPATELMGLDELRKPK